MVPKSKTSLPMLLHAGYLLKFGGWRHAIYLVDDRPVLRHWSSPGMLVFFPIAKMELKNMDSEKLFHGEETGKCFSWTLPDSDWSSCNHYLISFCWCLFFLLYPSEFIQWLSIIITLIKIFVTFISRTQTRTKTYLEQTTWDFTTDCLEQCKGKNGKASNLSPPRL